MVYPHQILEPGCIAREVLGFVAPQPNLRAGVAYIGSWAADHFFGEEIAEFKQKFRATLDSGLSAWKGIRQNMNIIGQHVSENIQNAVNNTIENVKTTVTDVAASLKQTANNIGTAVNIAIDNVKTLVGDAAKSVGDFFGGLFGGNS